MNWIEILLKTFWCGWGALGFGILFNVPRRSLVIVWIGGAIGGLLKFSLLAWGANLVTASFAAATVIGILSIPMAHLRHVPPMIFAIPSVIPLVPGVFAYRTMIGIIKLTGNLGADYHTIMEETVNNGFKTLFIMMSLAFGVSMPMHLMRRESVKKINPFNARKPESADTA